MLMAKQKSSAEVISMVSPMIEFSKALQPEPWQGTILVIEDDDPTLAKIMRTLVRSHFQALEARTGEEGLRLFETQEFDLIVLDILLPGMDGFEVCQSIRASRKPTPIIFLTTLGDTENLVRGLTMGADDYMVKPFKPEELVARIRTVLRRKQEVPAATHLKLRDLDLEYHSQKCFKNGRELDLTPTEFHLLMELCSTPGQAVSRSALSNSVWGPSHHVSEKSLDVYIARLRQKVEDDPTDPSFIRTVRGFGYVCE
jgi:DNA-binding response OmpR family regulator